LKNAYDSATKVTILKSTISRYLADITKLLCLLQMSPKYCKWGYRARQGRQTWGL